MKLITVESGQTMLDICIQEYGGPECVVQLAKDNNLTVCHRFNGGETIRVDEGKAVDKRIVGYFKSRGQKVNTGL